MAAMSLSPRARQRCPTESAGCHARLKWIFSRLKSVVTRASWPGEFHNRAVIPNADSAIQKDCHFCSAALRMRAIRAFSWRGKAQSI